MQLSDRLKGILLLILSSFGFATMSLFIRLAGDVPTMEKILYRNVLTSVICVILLLRSGNSIRIGKEHWADMFFRCFLGVVGMFAYFWTIDNMGIADSNMLSKTSPFFSILISAWLLKEKPSGTDLICVLIAMTGAAFVVKPTRGLASLPAFVGLFGGLTSGVTYTLVRKLGIRGVPGSVIVLYFALFSCLSALPFVVLSDRHAAGIQCFYLILAGSFACMLQLCLSAAYRYAPAKEISVYDYSQIVFAALYGLVFFGELPDLWSVLGYLLIFAGALLSFKKQTPA